MTEEHLCYASPHSTLHLYSFKTHSVLFSVSTHLSKVRVHTLCRLSSQYVATAADCGTINVFDVSNGGRLCLSFAADAQVNHETCLCCFSKVRRS
jgi:hypothetical protein